MKRSPSIASPFARAGASRRRLMQLFAGGAVTAALPPLEILRDGRAGRAHAQAAGAKKLVVFHFGNGAPQDYWQPLDLPREGLGAVMPRCTVIRGLSQRPLMKPLIDDGTNGHAAGMMTMLTNVPALPDPGDTAEPGHLYKAGGESFDQVVGRAINRGRPVRVWGTMTRAALKQWYVSYSKTGGIPLVTSTSAILPAFSDVTGAAPIDTALVARRQRVTTGLKRQANLMKGILGAADRGRIDQYLASIAQIEATLAQDATGGRFCTPPSIARPSASGNNTYSLDHLGNMLELGFRALQCDLTNVLVLSIMPGGAGPSLSLVVPGAGGMTHDTSHHDGDATKKEQYRKVVVWMLQRFADFLRKLDSEKDPAGKTVLDRSAVIGASEMGEGYHSPDNIAVVVAGGAFKKPAADALDAPGVPLANLWLTAMRAVGMSEAEAPRWGNSTGVLPALLS